MTVDIHPTARIDCDDFQAGDGTIIRAHAVIEGAKVHLGRECFIDEHAVIGGGSNRDGSLIAGDWLHMGMFSQVNTARDVRIGDEVGLGIGTRVFTHGAYLSEYEGFPVSFAGVTIGDRVWLPNAIVTPGVTIGSNVVVGAGSVVTWYLPDGCLAHGVPARVRKAGVYPRVVARDHARGILQQIADECGARAGDETIMAGPTTFNVAQRTIDGPVSVEAERARNQLRRHGIRFRYSVVGGRYEAWA